jgi:hypothetical protein
MTSVQDNNILLAFLLAAPFEAIKQYIFLQASFTSDSDIGVSLKEGQNRKLLLPTAYTAAESVPFFQTHFNVAEMQCSLSFRVFKSNCKVREI